MRMLCAVNGSHLFPAWCCGAGDGDTSHRCYQEYHDGAVSCHSVLDGARVGVDAGADADEGGDGTRSCHLAVPYCTLRNPPDLVQVSSCLERVGDKQDRLKRRDVQGIDMTKPRRVIEASDLRVTLPHFTVNSNYTTRTATLIHLQMSFLIDGRI